MEPNLPPGTEKPRDLRTEELAVLGGLCIVLGTFAPAANIDTLGPVNYWEVAGIEAVFLILAAIYSLILGWKRNYDRLWIPALIMWCAVILPFLVGESPQPSAAGQDHLLQPVSDVVNSAVDGIKGLFSRVAIRFVEVSWGLFLLAGGSLMLTLAALRGRK